MVKTNAKSTYFTEDSVEMIIIGYVDQSPDNVERSDTRLCPERNLSYGPGQ